VVRAILNRHCDALLTDEQWSLDRSKFWLSYRGGQAVTSRFLRTIHVCFTLWALSRICVAQDQRPQPSRGGASVLRQEGTDAESGTHYVRFTVLQGLTGDGVNAPPHFTMECTEVGGKRDVNWFVGFGGVAPAGFLLAFHATPQHPS
jgi:hypothetical protein